MREQIVQEGAIANANYQDHEMALAFVNFTNATNEKINLAQIQVDTLERQIAAKRDELREAFSEQKKFEIVDTNNKTKAELELNRTIGIKLDEIGTSMFIRKEKHEQ